METKNGEFQSYEAMKGRINATESRIQWLDQQTQALKGPFNFLKRRNLQKMKREDQRALVKMRDQTPVTTIEDAITDASDTLTSLNPQKPK